MVAGDDYHLFAELLADLRYGTAVEPEGLCVGNAAVVDVAGADHGVRAVFSDDGLQLVQEVLLILYHRAELQRHPEVPVGCMQYSHWRPSLVSLLICFTFPRRDLSFLNILALTGAIGNGALKLPIFKARCKCLRAE